MKNIIIMGIGRAGKTTLSNMIKKKYTCYNLIHSDSLKWALIRAKNKEEYYEENVEAQKEFEHGEYFQKTLIEFFKSQIRNDKQQYGTILESGQLHPKIVTEMIDFKDTIVLCLGLGNLKPEDIVEQCLKYDTKESWTYGLPKEYILKHAKDWYNSNEMLKKECPRYGIKYIDTSKNREKILEEILENLELKN